MSRAPKLLNPYSSWSSLFGATVRRLRLGMRAGRPLTQAELGKQIGYSDAASLSIRSHSRRWKLSESSRLRTARRSEDATATMVMSSPGRTAARSTLRTSRPGLSSTPGPPGYRGSGSMTCATATPPRRSRPGSRPR